MGRLVSAVSVSVWNVTDCLGEFAALALSMLAALALSVLAALALYARYARSLLVYELAALAVTPPATTLGFAQSDRRSLRSLSVLYTLATLFFCSAKRIFIASFQKQTRILKQQQYFSYWFS